MTGYVEKHKQGEKEYEAKYQTENRGRRSGWLSCSNLVWHSIGSGKLGFRPWPKGQPNEGLWQLSLWSDECYDSFRWARQLGLRYWSISQPNEGLRQLSLWSRESCWPPLITEPDNRQLRRGLSHLPLCLVRGPLTWLLRELFTANAPQVTVADSLCSQTKD